MSALVKTGFAARYGPWALVCGASEGLGEAFARAAAARGLNVVLVARRAEIVAKVAAEIATSGVQTRALAMDLAEPATPAQLLAQTADLEIGLVIYNAAASRLGRFLGEPVGLHLGVLEVNCRTMLALVHGFGERMRARRRGGIVLMSSLAGFQGSPGLATYAATKAFTRVFGESLWGELRPEGVDVVVCDAGATRTPGYLATNPASGGAMRAEDVAEAAIRRLGGGPAVVPGWTNRLAVLVMKRLLPRRLAVGVMQRALRARYGG